jgi:hypothetical protein
LPDSNLKLFFALIWVWRERPGWGAEPEAVFILNKIKRKIFARKLFLERRNKQGKKDKMGIDQTKDWLDAESKRSINGKNFRKKIF